MKLLGDNALGPFNINVTTLQMIFYTKNTQK